MRGAAMSRDNLTVECLFPWYDTGFQKSFSGVVTISGKLNDQESLFVRVNLANVFNDKLFGDFYCHVSFERNGEYTTERISNLEFLMQQRFKAAVTLLDAVLGDLAFSAGGKKCP